MCFKQALGDLNLEVLKYNMYLYYSMNKKFWYLLLYAFMLCNF